MNLTDRNWMQHSKELYRTKGFDKINSISDLKATVSSEGNIKKISLSSSQTQFVIIY